MKVKRSKLMRLIREEIEAEFGSAGIADGMSHEEIFGKG